MFLSLKVLYLHTDFLISKPLLVLILWLVCIIYILFKYTFIYKINLGKILCFFKNKR